MIDDLKSIAQFCPKNVRLLGMDVGKKTIGLALSGFDHSFATPLQTIKRTKFSKDMEILAGVIAEYEVGGFVLGYPVHMDGTAGRRCQSIRDFAQEMLNHPNVVGAKPWLALWDERLSTDVVEELVDKSVDKRKIKIKSKSSGLIDKLAAQLILQGALDYLNSQP